MLTQLSAYVDASPLQNEVDRYIAWPGQALAYKFGQLQFWAARRKAESELGPRFSLAEFHDTVLAAGAVTLPVLRQLVDAWIAAKRAAHD